MYLFLLCIISVSEDGIVNSETSEFYIYINKENTQDASCHTGPTTHHTH